MARATQKCVISQGRRIESRQFPSPTARISVPECAATLRHDRPGRFRQLVSAFRHVSSLLRHGHREGVLNTLPGELLAMSHTSTAFPQTTVELTSRIG